jgi:hypothetical protein
MFEQVGFEVLDKSYRSENGFSFFVFIRSKKADGTTEKSQAHISACLYCSERVGFTYYLLMSLVILNDTYVRT